MSKQTAAVAHDPQRESDRKSRGHLDRQYGNIGISAVVAALPYSGNNKNPAYARTLSQDDERSEFDTRSVLAV